MKTFLTSVILLLILATLARAKTIGYVGVVNLAKPDYPFEMYKFVSGNPELRLIRNVQDTYFFKDFKYACAKCHKTLPEVKYLYLAIGREPVILHSLEKISIRAVKFGKNYTLAHGTYDTSRPGIYCSNDHELLVRQSKLRTHTFSVSIPLIYSQFQLEPLSEKEAYSVLWLQLDDCSSKKTRHIYLSDHALFIRLTALKSYSFFRKFRKFLREVKVSEALQEIRKADEKLIERIEETEVPQERLLRGIIFIRKE